MRVDPLSREEEAKVSLVEGDFYALLAGKSQRKSFELEVPEVQTEIESTNFWVRRDDAGSKFANFDERALAVSAQGESVSLGRNEATLVRNGAPPSEKIDILPAATLTAPQDDQVAFDAAVEMSWASLADAAGYWLEVAYDPGFRRMTFSRWGLPDTHFQSAPLEVGSYYWRVAALDKFGLPGERSGVWRFHVRSDVTAPYLSIGEPAEGGIVRQSPLAVRGESEPDASLELNGSPLEVGADGRFETFYQPEPGPNQLTLKATDHAGNVTERSRSFVFMPDERAAVIFDDALPRLGPQHFVTARDVMSITGRTSANAQVLVRSGRRRRARFRLRRRRGAVRRQRADASRERGVRAAGHRAVGLRERGPVRDHGRPDPAADRVRGPAARRHRDRMAAAQGPGRRRRQASWSTVGRRS